LPCSTRSRRAKSRDHQTRAHRRAAGAGQERPRIWWSSDPGRLSKRAAEHIEQADELAICRITWYELGRLAAHGRIGLSIPIDAWLEGLSTNVRTVGITPAIARTATALPSSFSGDPADRLIVATALDRGWQLVTKDEKVRKHPQPRKVTVW
jgi:PIN domain nuclease of toxin-antitoxin system